MQQVYKLTVMLLIFLGMFFLGQSTDLKEVLKRGKKEVIKGAKKLEETAEQNQGSIFGRIIEYTEIMIQKSNIRMYVAYSIWGHFFISIFMSIAAFRWISDHLRLVPAVTFAIFALYVPYILLQIITGLIANREKKNAINFLIIFKNFLKSGKGDTFEAFEKVTKYVNEPLKSYIEVLVYEYNNKINALSCLRNFKEKLGTPELRLYVENLSISYVQGGDVEALTDTFIEEISYIDEEDDKQNAEDRILNFGLYGLLFLNFAIIYWMLNSTYKKEIIDSLWGQVVFVIDMFISIYIAYMTLEKS